ncbi:hypothetical protein RKD46_005098 [Streptomyces pseudovenezuelae]
MFPHLSTSEVVADVPPAHALDVVPVDTTDERGHLRTAVPVAGRRVVDEGRLDLLRVDELPLAQPLVGAPAAPGDDARARSDVRLRALPVRQLPRTQGEQLLFGLLPVQRRDLGGVEVGEIGVGGGRVHPGEVGGGFGGGRGAGCDGVPGRTRRAPLPGGRRRALPRVHEFQTQPRSEAGRSWSPYGSRGPCPRSCGRPRRGRVPPPRRSRPPTAVPWRRGRGRRCVRRCRGRRRRRCGSPGPASLTRCRRRPRGCGPGRGRAARCPGRPRSRPRGRSAVRPGGAGPVRRPGRGCGRGRRGARGAATGCPRGLPRPAPVSRQPGRRPPGLPETPETPVSPRARVR